jgi:hypothetical protein
MVNFQEPLLINNLIEKFYSWYDTAAFVSGISMDYFKYVAFMKNFMFDYARPFYEPEQDF